MFGAYEQIDFASFGVVYVTVPLQVNLIPVNLPTVVDGSPTRDSRKGDVSALDRNRALPNLTCAYGILPCALDKPRREFFGLLLKITHDDCAVRVEAEIVPEILVVFGVFSTQGRRYTLVHPIVSEASMNASG